MEDYWNLLPLSTLCSIMKKTWTLCILFAYFPTYHDSLLKPNWSQLLAVGDASGIQCPLSFGGFGALTRHLSPYSR
jgi:lycopene cyclase CruP